MPVLFQRLVQRFFVIQAHLFPQGLFYGLEPLSDEAELLLEDEFRHGEGENGVRL